MARSDTASGIKQINMKCRKASVDHFNENTKKRLSTVFPPVVPVLGVLLLLLLFNGGELLKAESDSAVVELHLVDKLRARSVTGWLRRGSWNFLATGGAAAATVVSMSSSSMSAVSGLATHR